MKKHLFFLLILSMSTLNAQHTIVGYVYDQKNNHPLSGISISILTTEVLALTDENGKFVLNSPLSEVNLNASGVDYSPQNVKIHLPQDSPLKIYLKSNIKEIEEVVLSTGYQHIPKERTTGSFVTVNKSQLDQLVTTNIMDRLPILANGVTIERGSTGESQLMIRGLSTMNGPRTPLVVLDDFPYEGTLSNINPNIVESIIVLKDAAAASIWGARAANGVIVIKTKKGKAGQKINVELNSNTTINGKPNLQYIKQMSSSDFIDVEQKLFDLGYYDGDISSTSHPVLTPVVDLLNQAANGIVSQEYALQEINKLRSVDVRDQYKKYMYTLGINHQYALNLSGGADYFLWNYGLNYDNNTGNLEEKYNRLNLSWQNTWKISDRFSWSNKLYMNKTQDKGGRNGYGTITMNSTWNIPYARFANEHGNAVLMPKLYSQIYKESVSQLGLVDWNYYPLTDWQHNIENYKSDEYILNSSLKYKIISGLEADIKYQFQHTIGNNQLLYDEHSFYARNYTNYFAQMDADGNIIYNVPKGGILDNTRSTVNIHNLRGQLNYDKTWNNHHLTAVFGSETRETKTNYESIRYYGYESDILASQNVDYLNPYPNFVSGEYDYIQNNNSLQQKNIRFVSLYTNAAYTFFGKYTISGSARRDASNLFGLKTNDQWNPFWSVGGAWKLSDEGFYNINYLSDIKFRVSYGFNGNIDPSMVAVTTIIYDSDLSSFTGTGTARIDNYYNPNLKWETSRITNFGIDFTAANKRIFGTIEYFIKKGDNLFGAAPLDYTTGITSLLMNVAGMKGNGWDFQLSSLNFNNKNINWSTTLNTSIYHDKVTEYFLNNTAANYFVSSTGSTVPISGIVGYPVYSIFAYKWAGLDPENGDPRGYVDGEISKDYAAITASDNGIEELKYFGSAIPTVYGSFLNSIKYKDLSLDVGLTYKFGYWFRRSSIDYSKLIIDKIGHSDYSGRWQHPGDERYTNIPSNPYSIEDARDQFYSGSEVLVEKGDHIRLQYITLTYQFKFSNKDFHLYFSANNIGMIWRANKLGLDPDYSWGNYALKPVTTYSIGIHTSF